MNRTYLYVIAFVFIVGAYYAYGIMEYRSGWKEGRAALVAEQTEKATAKLAKQTTRQQVNDSKAAAADESRKANTEVITRDVIKYIKTRDHSDCEFPVERVRIKSTAADNAACLAGFDDCSVRTGKSEQ